MNRLVLALSGLIMLLGSAAAAAEHRTIGTIEAEFNGEQKIWHLLYGEVDATHSAVWFSREGGVNTVVIGGYESQNVVFSEGNGMPTVSGKGSALIINFSYTVGAGTGPQLSTDSPFNVLLMAQLGDYSSSRMMQDAVLEISEFEVLADGTGRFTGTFSGTLPAISSDSPSVQVTNGRFTVEETRQATPR